MVKMQYVTNRIKYIHELQHCCLIASRKAATMCAATWNLEHMSVQEAKHEKIHTK